ncbi:acetate--CoA ligase family protein [Streptomyces purpurogeneiscleroticus]|uniref:acetate--CoA ligase family protein n=1 Tax=Streptomyces purpurogeneiscleroticus TaxID=68259 RepID=UPI001CBEB9A9|nr:acetate--CoA ligase family protein [Streptomyces purpurogeneiscleroticus]MBZ4019105.1 CoA-binding protein [Streptomyces purpurogeneiscleroticus]
MTGGRTAGEPGRADPTVPEGEPLGSAPTAPEGEPLGSLFDPRSVAVVGASANPEKWGYWLAAGALAGRGRRAVHLVNRRGGALDGVPFLPDLAALPSAPEQVVVAVPPHQVRAVVAEGLAAGARCFTVITSGGTGAAAERALASEVTAHGARLLGPNCMGVVDTTSDLRLSWGDFPAGQVGLVSQSGNLALEIGRLLARAGQGFSRFVSLGNQRDIDATDALLALVRHEPTRVIAAYVEDFRDGRRLARALAAAHAAGKPVLLLTVGGSTASGRAAASHTGALVSARATVAAVCRDGGALLLDTAGEVVDTAVCLLATRGRAAGAAPAPPPAASPPSWPLAQFPAPLKARPRVAVLADSGGQGALAADACAARGLDVPAFSAATAEAVAAHLPPNAASGNPVDLAGAGEADLGSYARLARTLLTCGEADAVVLTGYFGDYATGNPAQAARETEVAHELADAAASSGRPLLVHTMARDTPALAVLREHGVPVYERIEQAAAALSGLARLRTARLRPPLPTPPPALYRVPDGDYRTTRDLLCAYGLTFPAAEFVRTADEAAAAAHRVGFPLVLKAMGLAHKTEAGGVALGLADEPALRTAFARMRAATGATRYAVEAMATPPYAVELIAGVRRDPAFGPVLMAGIGGVRAELLADTALAPAPLTPNHARDLLLSLRHAPLLTGWRGAPAVDLDAASAALCALAHAAAEHPELTDIEINPLLVHPGGAVALDAAAVLS